MPQSHRYKSKTNLHSPCLTVICLSYTKQLYVKCFVNYIHFYKLFLYAVLILPKLFLVLFMQILLRGHSSWTVGMVSLKSIWINSLWNNESGEPYVSFIIITCNVSITVNLIAGRQCMHGCPFVYELWWMKIACKHSSKNSCNLMFVVSSNYWYPSTQFDPSFSMVYKSVGT